MLSLVIAVVGLSSFLYNYWNRVKKQSAPPSHVPVTQRGGESIVYAGD